MISMGEGGQKAGAQGRIRVVLCEPEYEMNVGAVARAMANFSFSELFIVAPKCNPLGFDAIKYSKHARHILEDAKVCKTLAQATAGCKYSVGTTGVIFRHFKQTLRSPISIRCFAKKLGSIGEGKIALLFGNEGIGLTEAQVSACDFLVTIPTSDAYSVLNLSHAVAICLYELSDFAPRAFVPAGAREKEALIGSFGLLVDNYAHAMRNPRKAKIAFRRIIGKAMPTDKECASVLGVLRRTARSLGERKHKGAKSHEKDKVGQGKT